MTTFTIPAPLELEIRSMAEAENKTVSVWITEKLASLVGNYHDTAVLHEGGNFCVNCIKVNVPFHRHHIVHRAGGGTDYLSNLATLCLDCHGLTHKTDYGRNWHAKMQNKRALTKEQRDMEYYFDLKATDEEVAAYRAYNESLYEILLFDENGIGSYYKQVVREYRKGKTTLPRAIAKMRIAFRLNRRFKYASWFKFFIKEWIVDKEMRREMIAGINGR